MQLRSLLFSSKGCAGISAEVHFVRYFLYKFIQICSSIRYLDLNKFKQICIRSTHKVHYGLNFWYITTCVVQQVTVLK